MALFKITSIQNNQPIIHYYDNNKSIIYDSNHNIINLASEDRCKDMVTNNEQRQVTKYKKQFKELRIQLGLNCNFHCKYCIGEHGGHNMKESKVSLPPKVAVKNLITLLKDNQIKPKHIVLWGGEPFVYWKYIELLVPALEDLYKGEVSIGTITNGSLLTCDKVDFLLNHNISLTISHDGPAFNKYRNDKDPLDNPEVIKAIHKYYEAKGNKRISYNIVVTPENCNILELAKYLDDKVGIPIDLNFECIVKNDRISDKIVTPFSDEHKKILLNHLFVAGTGDVNSRYASIRSLTSHFLQTLINGKNGEYLNYPCSAPYLDQVAIDMDGNILKCHGTDPLLTTIGHISKIEECINDTLFKSIDRTNCKDCAVLGLCRGGCPLVEQEDLDCYCKNLQLWYSGIFASAWYILFNSIIQKIEKI